MADPSIPQETGKTSSAPTQSQEVNYGAPIKKSLPVYKPKHGYPIGMSEWNKPSNTYVSIPKNVKRQRVPFK